MTLPAFRVKDTTSALRDLADALEARGLPAGDDVTRRQASELHDRAVTLLKALAGHTRACLHCGEPLSRKRHASGWEPASTFASRKYCGHPCRAAHLRVLTREKRLAESTKECEQCGGRIEKKARHTQAVYESLRFCSSSCAATFNNARRAPKPRPERGRVPQAPVRVREEAPVRRRRQHDEYAPAPGPAWSIGRDPRHKQHETVRVRELGEPCAKHPTYRLNVFGQCAACVAGARWARNERRVTARPSPEGGR